MEKGRTLPSPSEYDLAALEQAYLNPDPVEVTGHVTDFVSGADLGEVPITAAAEEVISPYGAESAAKDAVVSQMGGTEASVTVGSGIISTMTENARESLERARAELASLFGEMPDGDTQDDAGVVDEIALTEGDEAESQGLVVDEAVVADPDVLIEGAGADVAMQAEYAVEAAPAPVLAEERDEPGVYEADDEVIDGAQGEDMDPVPNTEVVAGEPLEVPEYLGGVMLVDSVELTDEDPDELAEGVDRVQNVMRALMLREVSVGDLQDRETASARTILGSLGVVQAVEVADSVFDEGVAAEALQDIDLELEAMALEDLVGVSEQ
jgi:hypothetical protein